MSGVTVRLALAAGYNVFPGVSALLWPDVDLVGNSPQPHRPRGKRKREKERERSIAYRGANASDSSINARRRNPRAALSRISPSGERLRNSFIYFPSLPRSLIPPSMSRFRERLRTIRATAYGVRIIEGGKSGTCYLSN